MRNAKQFKIWVLAKGKRTGFDGISAPGVKVRKSSPGWSPLDPFKWDWVDSGL